MGVILEGHGREADAVVVADPVVEEEALDSDLEAVEGDLGGLRCDDIQLPVRVNEVDITLGQVNGGVDGCGQRNVNRLLI